MRPLPGFLLLSILAVVACKSSRGGDAFAPAAPSQPVAPAAPDPPRGGEPSARTPDAVCPGADDAGASTGRACTEMGCIDGFNMSVEPLAAWPHGDYRYVLDVDGRTVTCEGSLPLKSCEQRSITCSDPAFGVTESGCAIDASQHAFGAVMIPGLPARVHVKIEHEGRVVADEDLDIDYERVQPNGPGCGPVCCTAGDELTLRF